MHYQVLTRHIASNPNARAKLGIPTIGNHGISRLTLKTMRASKAYYLTRLKHLLLYSFLEASEAGRAREPRYGFNQTSLVCLSRQSLHSPSASSTPTPSRLSSTSTPFSPFSSPSSLDFCRLSLTSPDVSPLFLLPPKFEP